MRAPAISGELPFLMCHLPTLLSVGRLRVAHKEVVPRRSQPTSLIAAEEAHRFIPIQAATLADEAVV